MLCRFESIGRLLLDRSTHLSRFIDVCFGPMAPIVDGGLAERWEAGGSAGTFQGDVVTAGGFKHSFLCMFAAAAAAAAAVTVAVVLSGALSNLHYHNVQCLIRGDLCNTSWRDLVHYVNISENMCTISVRCPLHIFLSPCGRISS